MQENPAQQTPQNPTTAPSPDLAAQLGQFLQQYQQAAQPPAVAGWPQQHAPQGAAPTALLLQLRIPMPDGSTVPAYLSIPLPPQASPPAVQQLVQQVAQQWPVTIYPPDQGGGWNGGGGGYRGGRRSYGGGRRW